MVTPTPTPTILKFLRFDIEELRCQKGTLSGGMAASVIEVEERPTEDAARLSGFAGLSWYLEAGVWVGVAMGGLCWMSFNEDARRCKRWVMPMGSLMYSTYTR